MQLGAIGFVRPRKIHAPVECSAAALGTAVSKLKSATLAKHAAKVASTSWATMVTETLGLATSALAKGERTQVYLQTLDFAARKVMAESLYLRVALLISQM